MPYSITLFVIDLVSGIVKNYDDAFSQQHESSSVSTEDSSDEAEISDDDWSSESEEDSDSNSSFMSCSDIQEDNLSTTEPAMALGTINYGQYKCIVYK